ncbi:MAG: DEAD/DEAH box helicase [Firmicutes bacterium]|nr:DEAD/DEAH box helicase [Bacillota bacterium]
MQIDESLRAYGRYTKQRLCLLIGGVSQHPQELALKQGVDILVATPGRLLDLVWQGVLSIEQIKIFVLDEADRMLDMGFINDVKRCLEFLPTQKQTLFFTATMPSEILKMTQTLLRDPVNITITPPSSTVDKITQLVYKTDRASKPDLIIDLLKQHNNPRALVFCRTKHGADRLCDRLKKQNIPSAAIHGDKSQGARQSALQGFKQGRLKILVATDIAARGIDIDNLELVFNYELPNEPESYVHRIGRTGRAGKDGLAISFCDYDELPYLKDIQRTIKKDIPEPAENPYPMTVFTPRPKPQRPPRKPQPNQNGQKNNPKK